jgi:diguanylate cyclase (GGDEF)-like protein/PAS domain S-box-containing protein
MSLDHEEKPTPEMPSITKEKARGPARFKKMPRPDDFAPALPLLLPSVEIKSRRSLPKSFDFKLVFEASPTGVAISHFPEGVFVEANDAFLNLHGYSRAELIGHNNDELQLWSYIDDREQMLALLEQHGHVRNFIHGYRSKCGRIASALASACIIEQKGERYLLIFLTDISELEKTQQELIEIERHYNLVFDYMLTGFAYCKMLFENGEPHDFVYLQVNKAFEVATGLTNVVGRKISELIPDIRKTNPHLLEIYGRVAQGGPADRFEIYLDYLQRWFSISVFSPKPAYFVALFDDITERKQAEEALREQKEFFYLIAENISDFISVLDPEGRRIYNSPSFRQFFRLSKAVEGADSFAEIHQEDRERVQRVFRETVQTGRGRQIEYRFLAVDGSVREMESRGSVIRDSAGRVARVLVVSRDVTERKKVEEALRLERDLNQRYLDTTLALMVDLDREGRITMINRALEKLLGYAKNELLGCHWFDTCVPQPESTEVVLPLFKKIMAGNLDPFVEFENSVLCRDGKQRVVAWCNTYRRDNTGHIMGTFSSGVDVTERKKLEEKIRQMAFYDPLTALPNRRLLDDRLSQAMAASSRNAHFGALMFLDLDNFKPLNDTHGHKVGDLLLVEVAERLRKCVRERDTVARFGGDEFVVMISELDADKTESLKQAGVIAEKISTALAKPYAIKTNQEDIAEKNTEHHCTASIGVVLFNNHQASQDDIFKWADAAMYQAKEVGPNLIRFYDPQNYALAAAKTRK